jgi:methyl-accepting chemotaxis protein
MRRSWTFGRKLGASFGLVVGLTLLMSGVSAYALRSVVASKDLVITTIGENLLETKDLQVLVERRSTAGRAYLLTGEASLLQRIETINQQISTLLNRLGARADSDLDAILERLQQANLDYATALAQVPALHQDNAETKAQREYYQKTMAPLYDAFQGLTNGIIERETKNRDEAKERSSQEASAALTVILAVAGIVTLSSIVLAFLLGRTLTRQIGAAFQHMQSASAELQTAANQQAKTSKEQVTAVQEMQSTMKELLATAKQIGESARHVSTVARDSQSAAKKGEEVVQQGKRSMGVVKQQVDLVVGQMLDLGKKSQQIGGVLELINELAEQTNILAVNATIEAASAGEAGNRFAAVADEIRKLADRVGGSTREIRTLVEEVRESVNSTVMATESGSKAVAAGAGTFDQVTSAFGQITSLVTNTAEAAREIELSTNQQTTAVEQVNVAVADVTQAAQETDASADQTLRTATELAGLSSRLIQLVESHQAVQVA